MSAGNRSTRLALDPSISAFRADIVGPTPVGGPLNSTKPHTTPPSSQDSTLATQDTKNCGQASWPSDGNSKTAMIGEQDGHCDVTA